MTWNYRVLEWTDRKEGTWQSIHEVYYNADDKPSAYSEEPAVVMSSDPAGNEADLGWVLDRMRDALSKPVLTADEFPESSQGASGLQPEALGSDEKENPAVGVRVGATPEPLTHLLIAIDDDRRAHLTYCAGRGAIVDAVVIATYGEPTLDQDAREEAAGITDALLEDGIFRFEGDPPLHLFELVPGAALRAPEPLTDAARRVLHELSIYKNNDPEKYGFAEDIELLARAALEGGVSRTEPALPSGDQGL